MKQFISLQRNADEIVEVRVVVGSRVIVSRVNHTHLARIRQTLAAIERIRSDAVRIGLFELALNPASVSRDFLIDAATAPADGPVAGSRTDEYGWTTRGDAELFTPQFA